jgi:hypothetical protein
MRYTILFDRGRGALGLIFTGVLAIPIGCDLRSRNTLVMICGMVRLSFDRSHTHAPLAIAEVRKV